MKAYLIAHPTYLTGVGANDTLPSNSQGYGMPNMSAMFDDASRYLLDQSVTFDNSDPAVVTNVRYIGLPKNKLRREGAKPDPRAEVKYEPQRARYTDIIGMPVGEGDDDEAE